MVKKSDNLFHEIFVFAGAFEWTLAVSDEGAFTDVSGMMYKCTAVMNCHCKAMEELQLWNVEVGFSTSCLCLSGPRFGNHILVGMKFLQQQLHFPDGSLCVNGALCLVYEVDESVYSAEELWGYTASGAHGPT